MDIIPIEFDDFEQLYELWKDAGLHLADRRSEQKDFLAILKLNPQTCLKVVINSTIIASSLGTWNGRRAWIYHFAVYPNYQRKNIGTDLLNETIKRLRKRGATKVIVSVVHNNLRAKQFYQKRGFTPMDDAEVLIKNV